MVGAFLTKIHPIWEKETNRQKNNFRLKSEN